MPRPNNLPHRGNNRNAQNRTATSQNQRSSTLIIDEDKQRELEQNKHDLFELIKDDNGFCDEHGIRYEVAEKIEKFAEYLNAAYVQNDSDVGVTSSSIRNIYDNYISIKRKFQTVQLEQREIEDAETRKENAFMKIKPELIFVKSKVNYTVERKLKEERNEAKKQIKELSYNALKEFINISTTKITTSYNQFEAFIKIFETLVGFMK
ncbi:type III-A CRISPR-associated protein Csm2 [Caldicellulosiruptor changbaiensis]|uniref:CRISPR system Cms protein Csm2 n=1 Tax=Caldicellulosiruptor changbaiensis TaxID=1222016 RepID=A0A3T0D215_9FIRM|nr:type III-A CRISPR-associated protein Csm2 [Caldicellulosiruptor changbaiensis]AZT89228.1 type III-A CRISPR-associated protein Csm2 [Caldicellulosiruptor changbaiensis]